MKRGKYIALGLLVLLFGACENEKATFSDLPSIYLGGDSEQNATGDSILFSFKKLESTAQTYDLNLMVYTTGVTVNHARKFELEVVNEESNVSSADYVIGAMEIPANSFYGKVPVTVNRQVAGLDLSQENARLTFRVKANENFEKGVQERGKYKLVWCDRLIKPTWWVTSVKNYLGPFSQARYQFILDYYGDLDFNEMGYVVDGSYLNEKMSELFAIVNELIALLDEYNAQHPGEPYLNDNGKPLAFGTSLSY